MRSRFVLLAGLLVSACAQYRIETPEGFEGETITISGKETSSLRIGDWKLSEVRRSSVNPDIPSSSARIGRPTGMVSFDDQTRSQIYQFTATKANRASKVRCTYHASHSYLDTTLKCNIDGAENTWLLDVTTYPEKPLLGHLQGEGTYDVRGIAPLHALVSGFYVEEMGELIAAVQVAGQKRVLIARGLDSRRRDQLMPALAALMLLDERVRM
jgi:hypothetical protein